MSKYNVKLPVVGYVEIEVEADSESEAIEIALEKDWRNDSTYEEVDSYKYGNENIIYSQASAELIEEDEGESDKS
ncbi:MAG: hypothetical protein ACRDD7_15065 [Peptostreptococcaceae bacterium]